MIKEDSCKIKFEKLHPWTSEIFRIIKKDLRTDHLLKSPSFVQKHFAKKALDKLTIDELSVAYLQEITEGDEELGHKIMQYWVLKNSDLYELFAATLAKINPQFDEIESLPQEVSAYLLNTAISKFGAAPCYIFCVMNAVVFTDIEFEKLRVLALSENKPSEEQNLKFTTLEEMAGHYEKEMRKISEKFERKMQGLERKYHQDMAGFKKQIAQLHKQIREKHESL